VVERLLQFAKCKKITGEAICNTIVTSLKDAGLDTMNCRAQNYDGAGNMAGNRNGAAVKFNEIKGHKAPYMHCASHDLNLVLCHACQVPVILCMIENVKQLGKFFSYPKRMRVLEDAIEMYNTEHEATISNVKFKTFCATRWVEKHQVLEDLHRMYQPIVSTLQDVVKDGVRKWESKVLAEAYGLLRVVSSSDFLAAFETVRFIFGFTKQLSLLLQGSSMDVLAAFEQLDLVIQTLQRERDNAHTVFEALFKEMKQKADVTGSIIEKPRTCRRQTLRENVEGSCEEYYRRSVFIPFLDHVLQEMTSRFSEVTKVATLGLCLLPCKVNSLTRDIEDTLLTFYGRDLPSKETFHHEVMMWKTLWGSSSTHPANITATLNDERVSRTTFPNLVTMLHLLLLTPVTSASVERANSALKFVKSDRRNRMGEGRLNALLLLFMHKDISIELEKVVDIFVRRRPRRLLLEDPMSD